MKLLFWLLVLLFPLTLWAGVAAALRRKLQGLYQGHFADARRERLFLSAVSFFITFTTARTIAYAVYRETISDAIDCGAQRMGQRRHQMRK